MLAISAIVPVRRDEDVLLLSYNAAIAFEVFRVIGIELHCIRFLLKQSDPRLFLILSSSVGFHNLALDVFPLALGDSLACIYRTIREGTYAFIYRVPDLI